MKKIFTIVTYVVIAIASINQGRADNLKPKGTTDRSRQEKRAVVKLTNNDRILSENGNELMSNLDIISLSVMNDTVFVTLKDSALELMDKDGDNYVKNSSKNSKAKAKRNKTKQ